MSGETALRLVVRGKVQNVWYRAWTVEQAKARNLRGWVRNRADGTVEALAIGPEEAVESLVRACREGPPAARVTAVDRHEAADDGSPHFAQAPTV